MVLFIGICAALQIVGSVFVYILAKSAVHEILAAIMFGMGVLAFGVGVLIENGRKQLEAIENMRRA